MAAEQESNALIFVVKNKSKQVTIFGSWMAMLKILTGRRPGNSMDAGFIKDALAVVMANL